jgi:hypothetical protein
MNVCDLDNPLEGLDGRRARVVLVADNGRPEVIGNALDRPRGRSRDNPLRLPWAGQDSGMSLKTVSPFCSTTSASRTAP